ncbi:hypothetical protein SFR_6323 [Streptomyces sp. FR-008]|nr:hypothetical protein SFR_6323 [Streptomyces sp. FR-008]
MGVRFPPFGDDQVTLGPPSRVLSGRLDLSRTG